MAQKGRLILGSSVTAQELTATLSPTGKQYSYQTNSDLGTFNPDSTFTSRYIGVSATGFYFDEVANAISGGPITINAHCDLNAHAVLNINLLTTLAYQRIQNLVVSGLTCRRGHRRIAERHHRVGRTVRLRGQSALITGVTRRRRRLYLR